MNIAVSTPWFEHHELLEDYVAAVSPELRKGDAVWIVDNGGAPDMPFRVAKPKTNLGFSGGSNLGMSLATTDAVLYLNNDISLVRRGWLDEIRLALEPGVLVGPLRYGAHANVDGHELPYIDGWCLGGMRQDLLDLGGFDESFDEPSYYGDNDLCLRARVAGMTLRDVQPGIRHKLNATAGPGTDPQVQAVSATNRARYQALARELLVPA